MLYTRYYILYTYIPYNMPEATRARERRHETNGLGVVEWQEGHDDERRYARGRTLLECGQMGSTLMGPIIPYHSIPATCVAGWPAA